MNWQHIDKQMIPFRSCLINEVKLTDIMAATLATTIASEVRFLPHISKELIRDASPVPLEKRRNELEAFQGWMEQASSIKGNPFITRAQIITQNYICFVYLPEACFHVLVKVCAGDTAARKCAKFLINNPIRAFRNAIAHANWMYREDFGAVRYWARKGDDPDAPMDMFEVEQNELSFWQSLSRCVAYASYYNL